MNKKFIIFAIVASAMLGACTPNERARSYGGSVTYEVTKGHKVTNVTWKETDLWILTRPMREDEKAETWTFTEKSSFGWRSGEVILKESR